ncbi:MAG: M13 family metallopeptidase [Acidobacteriota bacterium]|nr:M13 family metallopeptidase [Acidobacteriota bacterium]
MNVIRKTAGLLVLACPLMLTAQAAPAAAKAAEAPAAYQPIPLLDKSIMDTQADPCADFYQYACGNWSKQHPIPADSPESDQFYNLEQVNTQVLHKILESAAVNDSSRDAIHQKIGDYYASCMDETAVNEKSAAALKREVERIDALRSKAELPALLAHLQLINVGAFLSFSSQQDFTDATKEIAVASQSGLGLPEKDYYFRAGEKDDEIRQQYVAHIAKILSLLGTPEAQAKSDAAAIMKLETALAKVSLDITAQREPHNIYHMKPPAELQTLTPGFDWAAFFQATGAPRFTEVNVAELDFFPGMAQVIQDTDLSTIKAYLRWQLVTAMPGTMLPRALDEENFDFFGRKLAGQPEQRARWKRCVTITDRNLPEALGRVYVEHNFSGQSKEKALAVIHDIEVSMAADIDSLDWMSAETKVKAREKLHLIANKIGYPEKWRDYSSLNIVRGDAFGNGLRAVEFESHRQLAKIGQPVNRDEWFMSPPTVNAYYDPSMNNINFPAGVLQPAFFDAAASDALNYGHAGAVIGHEITHGFDDQGRQFDGYGNLKDWWTKDDAARFEEKSDCTVKEYAAFKVGDTNLNGKLTLGENTADNGGMRIAWMAFLSRIARENAALDTKTAAGFTPRQEFFLAFTQNWCSEWRPELERLVATTDPHSPSRFRANGVLVNMPEFGQAFGCKVGQPMRPAKTCRVW